jgi:ribonuclease BN (tRNA processing enzyme)
MRVRVLGAHNLESARTGFVSLLVDDLLALDAGSLVRGLTLEEQFQLRALLLTHRHFDHIRDVAALGIALYPERSMDLYAPEDVLELLQAHMLNNVLYPDFFRRPSADAPTLRPHVVKPDEPFSVAGYQVLPVPGVHGAPVVGYQVTDATGASFFYSGDAGPGSAALWDRVGATVLCVDVTLPDRLAERAREAGHLTPRLLELELARYAQSHARMPLVYAVHLYPLMEEEVRSELAGVRERTGHALLVAQEGMEIALGP